MAGDELGALQARLERAAPPDLDLSFRPMFGGIMGYADGRVFASLSNVGLALKLTGEAQAEMLSTPGAVMLRYGPNDPPSKSYVVVPPALLDTQALRPWIARCVAQLKPAKPKRRAPLSPLGRG